MTSDNDLRLIDIAWRLDRLRWVPRSVLSQLVNRDELCHWIYPANDPPEPTGTGTADRELAVSYCAGCPVRDECLELELRTAGENTVGVWGAMPDTDRRALYPHWRQCGERAEPTGQADAAGADGGQP